MVIIGRGGQVILKDRPNVLHVRIEAPLRSAFTVSAATLSLPSELSAMRSKLAGQPRIN